MVDPPRRDVSPHGVPVSLGRVRNVLGLRQLAELKQLLQLDNAVALHLDNGFKLLDLFLWGRRLGKRQKEGCVSSASLARKALVAGGPPAAPQPRGRTWSSMRAATSFCQTSWSDFICERKMLSQ